MKVKIKFFLMFGLFLIGMPKADATSTSLLEEYIEGKYKLLDSNGYALPGYDLFERGIIGYLNLKESNSNLKKDLLTVIDFRTSSKNRRLWVIDLRSNKILHHTVVAHGRNTGEEYAKSFSNTPHSNKSSVGFYITGEMYYGKHGLSLRLDGQEPGFNSNARRRAVVMHGANYATRDFAKTNGRLGRSFGCPAIPMKYHKEIIRLIANQSTLFIYYPLKEYEASSWLNNRSKAEEYLKSNFSVERTNFSKVVSPSTY